MIAKNLCNKILKTMTKNSFLKHYFVYPNMTNTASFGCIFDKSKTINVAVDNDISK